MSKNREQFLHNLKHKRDMRKYFINYKHKAHPIETIDQAETKDEALYLLSEYRMAFNQGDLTISKKEY